MSDTTTVRHWPSDTIRDELAAIERALEPLDDLARLRNRCGETLSPSARRALRHLRRVARQLEGDADDAELREGW